MKCHICNTINDIKAVYCHNCGTKLQLSESENVKRSSRKNSLFRVIEIDIELSKIAENMNEDVSLRKMIIEDLPDNLLANVYDKIVKNKDENYEFREMAIENLKNQEILTEIAMDKEENDEFRIMAINKLKNKEILAEIIKSDNYTIVFRKMALNRLLEMQRK